MKVPCVSLARLGGTPRLCDASFSCDPASPFVTIRHRVLSPLNQNVYVRKVKLREGVDLSNLFGPRDLHLRLIEDGLHVRVSARGNEVTLEGQPEAVGRAEVLLCELAERTIGRRRIRSEDVTRSLKAAEWDQPETSSFLDTTHVPTPKGWVVPKTPSQQIYLEAIQQHDLVIGIGPAGTGKTYMAMAMALASLTDKAVQRVVLARPAVEAGERLGFLPGDMFAKVHPYLRPLYDALYAMMDMDRANRLIERGDIEMAPLAFMRGRTLNDAFVILDEAQNATAEQMKMFLTRLGFNSKAVVTGDVTQVDLPPERPSGLIQISEILRNVDGIKFVYFQDRDVVRHRLVQDIIKAYNQHGNGTGKSAVSAATDE